jgi:hypothetical protein
MPGQKPLHAKSLRDVPDQQDRLYLGRCGGQSYRFIDSPEFCAHALMG